MKTIQRFIACAGLCVMCIASYAQDSSKINNNGPLLDRDRTHATAMNMIRIEANELIKLNRLEASVPLLEQLVADDPGHGSNDNVIAADVYTRLGRAEDVLRVLHSVIYPKYIGSCSKDPGVRMLYVLALLEKHQWTEAVAVYEPTIDARPTWWLPGIGPGHTLPDTHFTPHSPDYTGLRAQAYLILGTIPLPTLNVEDQVRYMLDHLKLALKYNPKSPDAHFVSGLLLMQTSKFAEARMEFEATEKVATFDAQPEIKAALADLKKHEDDKKLFDSQQAARAATAAPKH